jgi:membrane associated rhomboid family serine protease
MRQAPPLTALPRYPIIGGVGLLAVGVSLAYWSKTVDVSPLMEDHEIRDGQVWRLVTSILPHGDPIHLAFNLLWLWVLGTLVEDVFGHVRTLLLVVLLAAGSGAAEYAFIHGGIGLSGVGYGLVGFLWVLSRRDERFRGAVDAQTAQLFVGWFFLCIVLTAANVWHVANVAHGVGALLGVLVGLTVARGALRPLYGAAVALLLAGFGAAVYARPYVNLTVERAEERAQLGYEAAERHDDDAAVRHFRAAIAAARGEADASWWFNLGLVYERQKNLAAARVAYSRAAEIEPEEKDYRDALEAVESRQKWQRVGKAIDRARERAAAKDGGAGTQPAVE